MFSFLTEDRILSRTKQLLQSVVAAHVLLLNHFREVQVRNYFSSQALSVFEDLVPKRAYVLC